MATISWNSSAIGDWNAPGNWSLNRIPLAGDIAAITSGTANLLTGVDPATGMTLLLGGPTTLDGLGNPAPNAFLNTLNTTFGPSFTIADTSPGTEGVLATAGFTAFNGTIRVSGTNTVMLLGVDRPFPTGVKGDVVAGATPPAGPAAGPISNPGNIGQFQNNGTINVSGGAGMLVAPANTLDNGHVSMLIGTINLDNGVLASTFVTLGPPSGGFGTSGTINLAHTSTAAIQLATNIDVNFADGTGNRLIFSSTTQTAVISGFQFGDTIWQTPRSIFGSTTPYGNLGLTYNTATQVLEITTGVSGTPFLDYTFAGSYTQSQFRAADDAQGNLVISLACFAAGSRILTTRGEVVVQALRVGDEVVTAGAKRVAVTWLGHRRTNCRRHARPWDVFPVRVHAGAFGDGLPRRDLLLSPDHAVFVNGVLIPVRYLINGATITQEPAAIVAYWHVELEHHDVLLAEGLPTESYLDTGNRAAFENGGAVVAMHPDFARAVWDARACARLVLDGPALIDARAALLRRALRLGHATSTNALLTVRAGGSILQPQCSDARTFTFDLPAGTRTVRLQSRSAVPAHVKVCDPDARRLGVAVSRLALDGNAIALTDARLGAGWFEPEDRFRWTTGNATITTTGARQLSVQLLPLVRYWTARNAGPSREAAMG